MSASELQSAQRSGGVILPTSFSDLHERYAALCSALPLPDLRTESWHYGRPDRFVPGDLSPATSGEYSQRGKLALDVAIKSGGMVLWLDPDGYRILSGKPEDSGLHLELIGETAPLGAFDALQGWLEYINERDSDRLEAEQLSRLKQILHLQVPQNTAVSTPLHVVIDMPPDGQARFEQIVVNAGSSSSLDLHLHVTGDDVPGQSLMHYGVHLQLADKARVQLVRYQNTGAGNDLRGVETQLLARDASCSSTSLFVGGRHLRHDVSSGLAGSGSESILRGLYLMGGRQTASIFSHQDHRVANCHSDLLFKGTMLDRAAASYLGQISVAPDAQGTDAYQSNRSLLLSPRARSSSSPQLEIEANDVRCSHGASVANVSDEELFYLESRGIDPDSGRQLLISGFLAEIADLVPDGVLQEYVNDDLLGRRV